MEEHKENDNVITPGEEERNPADIEEVNPVDTEEISIGLLCPFCSSPEIHRNKEYRYWRCVQCDRTFQSPVEGPIKERGLAAMKSPWELPDGAAAPERYHGKVSDERDSQRINEESALLLLPHNLQIAFAWALKLAIVLAGIFSVILGSHGLLVYFNAVEGALPEGRDGAALFLATDVPGQLRGIVEWCSTEGLKSWTVPASLIGAGPLLWILQTYVRGGRFRL
jgi:ribosomal protein L37AE/L43A